jgi:hypothetical protein
MLGSGPVSVVRPLEEMVGIVFGLAHLEALRAGSDDMGLAQATACADRGSVPLGPPSDAEWRGACGGHVVMGQGRAGRPAGPFRIGLVCRTDFLDDVLEHDSLVVEQDQRYGLRPSGN